MRLVEKCCCGASIELSWDQPRNIYDKDGLSEASRADAEIKRFARRHKACAPLARAENTQEQP